MSSAKRAAVCRHSQRAARERTDGVLVHVAAVALEDLDSHHLVAAILPVVLLQAARLLELARLHAPSLRLAPDAPSAHLVESVNPVPVVKPNCEDLPVCVQDSAASKHIH